MAVLEFLPSKSLMYDFDTTRLRGPFCPCTKYAKAVYASTHYAYALSDEHLLLAYFPLSITELPECRLEIASNKDILHQTSCISVAPSLTINSAQVIASFFSNLASTPETHQYITNSVYLHRLLQACEMFLEESDNLPLLE